MSAQNIEEVKHSGLGKVFQAAGELLQKIVCIFDDIPFLLKGILPQIKGTMEQTLKLLGSYLLGGVAAVSFLIELIASSIKLDKWIKADESNPKRNIKLASNATKVGLSSTGILVCLGLIAATALSAGTIAVVLSIMIPSTMAAINGVSVWQRAYSYMQANKLPSNAENDKIVSQKKKGLTFSLVYLGLMLSITALATITVLGTIGVLSLGLAPTAVLAGVVCTGLAIKIYEIASSSRKPTETAEKSLNGSYTLLTNKGVVNKDSKIERSANDKSKRAVAEKSKSTTPAPKTNATTKPDKDAKTQSTTTSRTPKR